MKIKMEFLTTENSKIWEVLPKDVIINKGNIDHNINIDLYYDKNKNFINELSKNIPYKNIIKTILKDKDVVDFETIKKIALEIDKYIFTIKIYGKSFNNRELLITVLDDMIDNDKKYFKQDIYDLSYFLFTSFINFLLYHDSVMNSDSKLLYYTNLKLEIPTLLKEKIKDLNDK